jgi:DNA (cytosine-5)-methyltransferase 1
MRYLSVCSGIEAASVAWSPLGWTCAGLSEIEPFPRAVLQERFGAEPVDDDHRYSPQSNVLPLFGDFTKIEAYHVGPIDLLVGGTPCQSFSIAGKRLGLDDPRGNLTLEFLALAKRVRPRWIVWENVPGVLSDDGGKTMGTFLWLLGELGYRWAYRVLDAQFVRVDGFDRAVPQRRRRVFVVGHLGDDARAQTVLFERESLRGHPAPRRQSGQRAAPTLAARTRGGGGLGTDFDCDGGLICADVAPTLNAAFGDKQGLEDQHINGGGACLYPPVSMCLNAGGMGRQDAETETLIPTTGGAFDVAHTLKADGFDASEDGTGRGTPLVPVPLAFSSKDYGNDVQENLSPTLRSMGHDGSHANGGGQVAIAIQERAVSENPDAGPQGSGVRVDGASFTLEARHHVQAVAFDMRGREGGAMPEGPHDTANIRAASGGSSRSYVAQGDAVAFSENQRGELRERDVTNALAGGGGKPGQGYPAIRNGWAVRRLTPTECERLQGFPDGHTAITHRGKPAADGPRYKACGNSMAVNVMRWLGERIEYVERAVASHRP